MKYRGCSFTRIETAETKSVNLSHIIQSYLGMQPADKGCSNWTEMQSKMEEELNEYFKTKQ